MMWGNKINHKETKRQRDKGVNLSNFQRRGERGEKSVEIRKMYLLPEVRGEGLGKFLLTELEKTILSGGYQEIWMETRRVVKEAVILYEK
jgi:ribosomal protein S18 acetylase RimI-like enzyme